MLNFQTPTVPRVLRRSLVSLSLLAASCAQAPALMSPQPATVAAAAGANVVAAAKAGELPYAGAKYRVISKDNKFYCADCGTELNDQGRHKLTNLVGKALHNLNGDATAAIGPTNPASPTYGTFLRMAASRLGMSDAMHVAAGTDPYAHALAPLTGATLEATPGVSLWNNCGGGLNCENPTYQDAVDYVAHHHSGCCAPEGINLPDPPYCYEDAFVGQNATPGGLGDDKVALYRCFPYCYEGPDLSCTVDGVDVCNPVVNFAGMVVEKSTPDIGGGYNGGIAGAAVTLTGSQEGTINLTTDASGHFGGSYHNPNDPTARATRWGLSATGSASDTLTLLTDAAFKLGLTSDSAPASDGQSFSLGIGANGGPGTTMSRSLHTSPQLPAFVRVARNAEVNSTLNVTTIDNPFFTWFGDAAFAAQSRSAAPGATASSSIAVRTMHKWVRINVNFTNTTGLSASDVALQIFDRGAVTFPTPATATYDDAGLISLPTSADPGGSHVQTNPSAAGATTFWLTSTPRLANFTAPYKGVVVAHAEGKFLISDPTAAAEVVTLDDASRISGVINLNLRLKKKEQSK
ncbi:MAG: hypothetical protein JWM80_5188 [Cyanobacteria bacterium RYN_339]|nr:hypothetical protein [Cyanobacteria bacterium RYN_339]